MGQGLSRGARQAAHRVAKEGSKVVDVNHKRAAAVPPKPPPVNPGVEEAIASFDTKDGDDVVAKFEREHSTPAGQWTAVRHIDDGMLDFINQKDEELVRAMSDMEIRADPPVESVGSRKIQKSLPRDRTTTVDEAPKINAKFDGTLTSAQITEMLGTFQNTPHDTPVSR